MNARAQWFIVGAIVLFTIGGVIWGTRAYDAACAPSTSCGIAAANYHAAREAADKCAANPSCDLHQAQEADNRAQERADYTEHHARNPSALLGIWVGATFAVITALAVASHAMVKGEQE